MNRKITSNLIIFLVLVSLVCSYCGIALYHYANQSKDVTLSETTTTTQESQENGRLPSSEPYQRVSGDKIKDVKPH